jgi:hypothetical protein
MTDKQITDPIRRIATDAATDAVPLAVDGDPDFAAWRAVVDDVRDDIVRAIVAAAEVSE